MAASTKTTSAEAAPKANRQNRRREISGILLLAGGLFTVMSLLSMQLGGDPLMGPGGAAVATGFYSLFGLGAYLVIAAMGVAAVRCFRALPIVDGVREGWRAAAARRGRRAAAPAVRRQRRQPPRSGRTARAVAGRGG